ncbi:glycosyltransferase family 4 protein [Desulfobacula phenolica]|uniref:UDP-GlcNAc:undecaprenyl-phosphate GlcNAc-1-phosphate transferase n=1 Tax=Desulfobacula phenolica TaxID=90732 RepID=A0A1H2DPM2_9BACT|nr:glycosyltransferase family 4 protein [Desulfobacula phenolica]SDT84724.1 UDP-GlcNAc:undecaprenyl-phosphate GlcNAc-1-phosphate transferase [Desulfobacula phenolica]
MTLIAFLKHLVFAFGLFLFSSMICWKIIQRAKIMDTPNHRSSHTKPIPTAGGLAIVTTFFSGMGIIYCIAHETMITHKIFMGFTVSSLLIAGMSFYDDYKHKPLSLRLLTQIVAIIAVISFGMVITRIDLPFPGSDALGIVGYLITFVWILGLTNAYNFMDGLNGMAGGNAVITSFFLGIISFGQGSNFTYIVCYTLMAGTLGFLIFNFPKGKLFMGDVGSTFLGFTFATLAIISSLYDNAHTSLLVMPLLLFHFIYDTFFTFLRRLVAKENIFQAHRTHLYQLFNQLGYSHTVVTLFYCATGLAQGFGAFKLINTQDTQKFLLFIPYLVFQIIYSMVILYCAKKKQLI